MTPEQLSAYALEGLAAGLSIVPPREDGSKRPIGEWREYQTRLPTIQELEQQYSNGRTGIGIVCGEVSGNLEMLEFEDKETYDAYIEAAQATGLGVLVSMVEHGYLEESPNGGRHWLYRCIEIEGNTKLARRPKKEEEKQHENDTVKVLIETRGEGGYVIIAPSNGHVHPTDRPYLLLGGRFGSIVNISKSERERLHKLARTFDRMPKPTHEETGASVGSREGVRPGDDYNRRGSWQDLLTAHGWTLMYSRGEVGYWRRPGKEGHDWSATVGHEHDEQGNPALWVFSTSTPFQSERVYSKFGAYMILKDLGSVEAARELGAAGYGEAPQRPVGIPQGAGQEGSEEEGNTLASQMISGGTFILDAPKGIISIWGDSDSVAWPQDEPLILAGPPGIGKTTIAQQLVLGRLGINSEVLGLPVMESSKKILYLACDRPAQAQRSFARMVDESDREILDERLVFWKGPPPGDVGKNPKILLEMCLAAGADTIVIDSLKDIALKLSDDEVGSAVNSAHQRVVAAGIQLLGLHHQRKRSADNTKPTKLDDLYGSVWIGAGAGSVILLWGEAGDEVVELSHLKPAHEPIGPWTIEHDHQRGISMLMEKMSVLDIVRARANGVTTADVAIVFYGTHKSNPNQIRRMKRELVRLENAKLVHKVPGGIGGPGGSRPDTYYPVTDTGSNSIGQPV